MFKTLIIFIFVTLFSSTAVAAQLGLSTTSMFGYGVEKQSSTGYALSGGSVILCDITKKSATVDYGLRTNFAGASGKSKNLYRYSMGPVIHWNLQETFVAHGSIAYFREESVNSNNQALYESTGQEYMLGLLRKFNLTPRAFWTVGSFVAYHQGQIHQTDFDPKNFSAPKTNISLSQGVTIGLNVSM